MRCMFETISAHSISAKRDNTTPINFLQNLSAILPSFSRARCSHVDTLGAEKKSGVPYILMSHVRHRQTPLQKHDEKTRHVGFAHVAQPSYRAFAFFGEVSHEAYDTLLRTCWDPFGISQLLGLERRSRGDRPTLCSEVLALALRHVEDNAPYQASARWRVLGAASRRAIASRKAVPADVKEPFVPQSSGTRRIIPHPPSENKPEIKICGIARTLAERFSIIQTLEFRSDLFSNVYAVMVHEISYEP